MKLFVFVSNDVNNIWTGIGAKLWAVSEKVANNPSIVGKADKNFDRGAMGIFYVSKKNPDGSRNPDGGFYTTPFIVTNADRVNPDDYEDNTIWKGKWFMPFSIQVAGNPTHRISLEEMRSICTSFHEAKMTNSSASFSYTEISNEDWMRIAAKLVHPGA